MEILEVLQIMRIQVQLFLQVILQFNPLQI
ncbi:hypothetical protein N568_0110920 [Lactococcus garvieae TRF1]|uniref:Uncharacterized protein n=1 Tax=Lactococcus garvieae TRF1 TaxID=1380772 RepID=V8AM55_9LACT|nr:hypothetical protein N568_0110920 [Lactococcus garvieae TRF1]